MLMKTKVCITCKKELDINKFYKSKAQKDGTINSCKTCKALYYQKNKEKIKQRLICNKDIMTVKHKKYRQENKKKIKTYNEKYRHENKEKTVVYRSGYYQTNKLIIAINVKKYQKEHLQKYNLYSQKRRSLKKQLAATLTIQQWENIKFNFDNKCCYCGKKLSLEMEHFIPITNNGEYTLNNIIPSCKSCNSSKGAKDFFKWYPKYKNYSKKRENIILKFLGYEKDIQQLRII